jgi:hypothetical protein
MCISLSLSHAVIEGNAVVFIISPLSILNKQMGQIIRPPGFDVPLYGFNRGFAPEGAPPVFGSSPEPDAPSGSTDSL